MEELRPQTTLQNDKDLMRVECNQGFQQRSGGRSLEQRMGAAYIHFYDMSVYEHARIVCVSMSVDSLGLDACIHV